VRILVISQGFPKYVGDSTAPFMVPIVRGLVARGHAVEVVLPYHPEFRYPEEEGLRFSPYRYSPLRRLSPWGFGSSLTASSRARGQAALVLPAVVVSLHRRISKLLATHPFDVVHAHWLLPNAWVAAGPAAEQAVPLVATLHGSDVAIAERNALLGHLARRALRSAGAVTAVSDDLRGRAEQLGADPGKARTVHLGVDIEAFAPRATDPATRTRLGASDDQALVIAVGRLVEKKGFRLLIEAVSRVERVHLTIVGGGELRAELEAMGRSSGAPVTFTGNLDHSAVSDAVAAADIVAVPSVVDSAGNVDGLPETLLEALAAGRPVVASAVGGIPEVVTDGVNGLLVRGGDLDGLANALRRLRDQRELREQLGNEARRRAIRDLSWDATAEAFEQAYVTAGAGAKRRGATRS
jgi:glycosyltransferase involved in cell wall biosynthesis